MLGASEYRRDYGAPAPKLRAEFYLDTVKDMRASLEAGRDVHTQVERIKIIIPGAHPTIAVHNVTDRHRNDYADQYRRWKEGLDPVVNGTPLEEWSILNPAAVADLKSQNLRTVEEIAGLSDVAAQGVGIGGIANGMTLRERARGWLDDAQHDAYVTKILHRCDALESKNAALQNQVDQLSRHMLQMAQSWQGRRDRRPDFQTYVPGEDDPVELAKGQGGLPGLGGAASALSALAVLTSRPRRRRDPRPEMADMTPGAVPSFEEAQAAADAAAEEEAA